MIKIPTLFKRTFDDTLFKRTFDDNHVVSIEPIVTPGFERMATAIPPALDGGSRLPKA